MKKALETCKNCEQQFEQGFSFCPYCGQKSNDKLTVSVLFYNTISNYFSVDARFFKSFLPLMFRPGYLAKRFVEGKRLLYLHPAQMYLFISVVFFFLFSFISRNQVESVNTVLHDNIITERVIDSLKAQTETNENVQILDSVLKANQTKKSLGISDGYSFNESVIDSLIAINAPDETIYKAMGMDEDAGFFGKKIYGQILKFYKYRNGGTILQGFYDTIPITMFFLLPIFALILKFLYFKKAPYSYHLVFTLYFFAFVFMAFSFLVIVDLIWKELFWLNIIVVLSVFLYLYLAVIEFYRQGKLKSLVKLFIATSAFILVVVPSAIVVMFLVAFLFY